MKFQSAIVKSWVIFSVVCGSLAAQAPTAQKGFATPKAAAEAIIHAAEAYDVSALENILGPGGKDLVSSGDPVLDKDRAVEFVNKAREKHTVVIDPKNPNRAILSVGNNNWPVPIPIVRRNGGWYFDAKAGRDEVLMRRIGEDELDAITVSRGFVEAQKEYALNSEGHQYAQRIISSPGKKDGLYWENEDGKPGGPIAQAVARALQEGYTFDKPTPYHGYYFKILKGQGPAAKLGQLDFVVNGQMIGGFALVAVPAEYRVSGVKTFLVSHEGVVYEKDLGPDSLKIVKAMDRYNPDKTWRATNAEWTTRSAAP
jgi:hypothetical protein